MIALRRGLPAQSPGLAIDLGTAGVRVASPERVLVDESSAVLRTAAGDVIAVGTAAREMTGRNDRTTQIVYPVCGGAVMDVDLACALLERIVHQHRVAAPSRQHPVVVAVPLVADLQRRALTQCVRSVFPRCRVVHLDAAVAAAIGAGLAVHEPRGSMVVDVGHGATEAAIVSLGGVVVARAAGVGGRDAEAAVVDHVQRVHEVEVGDLSAARAVRALSPGAGRDLWVRGSHRPSGLPRQVALGRGEGRSIIAPVLEAIVRVVTDTLDAAPPTVLADVMADGIVLTGGASRIDGVAGRVAAATGVPVVVAERSSRAVIDGARQWLGGPLRYQPYRMSG